MWLGLGVLLDTSKGEEKKLDAMAHWEGQVWGGAAQLTVAPVNA
jgi:hypothetical protein